MSVTKRRIFKHGIIHEWSGIFRHRNLSTFPGKGIPLFMTGHKNYLQVDYLLGPGPPLIKRNLPGRGLTKVEKHYPRLYIKKSSMSQPEDGFRNKAETCSCNDFLIIFKNIYLCNKRSEGCQVLYTFWKYWKHNGDALPENYNFLLDKFIEHDVQSFHINTP
jgi:hypothetical protein